MAQGDSKLSICNIALIALGEDPLTAFPDTSNKRGILCNARYDDVRRFTLRTHIWNCARKQASIAASATPPTFRWKNKFPLPVDFLRFTEENQDLYDMSIWDVMTDGIYTNDTAPLQIVYIMDLQDCTVMDATLIHVIAYNLAAEIALPLTQNVTKAAGALQVMKAKYDIARFIGAQENAPREWDVDIWLRARA